jgi:hypothetical protein
MSLASASMFGIVTSAIGTTRGTATKSTRSGTQPRSSH